MLDRLFFLSLILNATGLFRFIAPHFNLTIGQISIFLLVFNILYILVRFNQTNLLLKNKLMMPWIILLLIWPMLSVIYSPSLDFREIGLLLYFFSLFLGTILWVQRKGLKGTYLFCTISFAATIFGMLLSKISIDYFEQVAILANANEYTDNSAVRFSGFYMQPNNLAIALCLLYIIWFGLMKNKTIIKESASMIVFLLLELMTGSRMGILVALGIIGLHMSYNWSQRIKNGRLLAAICFFLFLFINGIYITRTSIEIFGSSLYGTQTSDLFNRIESIINFKISTEDNIYHDFSIIERRMAQKQFIEYIAEKPVVGYGHGADIFFLESGVFWKSAHSQLLTSALQYGIFYPFFIFIAILPYFRHKFRKKIEFEFQSNTVFQFTIVFIVLFCYSSIFEIRLFYITFGIVIALILNSLHYIKIKK